MANFSYSDYQNVVAAAQANANGNGTKVGYLKLANDGDVAIARINIASTDELAFAAVHTINLNGRWLKVSCHNPLNMNGASCALCSAAAANPKGAISKASKKVYVPMLVSYRDPSSTTGYTVPVPVVWERPASFSRELANKLMIAGDLRNTLVLITRNGKAGDMQTTYTMDILPETHPVFKPEMIPADFSAFDGFNVARHSYWEKTTEEIQTYLATGQFPDRAQANNNQVNNVVNNYVASNNTMATGGYVAPSYSAPVTSNPVVAQAAPVANNPYSAPVSAQPAPSAPVSNPAPTRNFTGFSF
jgi:hypothetical protein